MKDYETKFARSDNDVLDVTHIRENQINDRSK